MSGAEQLKAALAAKKAGVVLPHMHGSTHPMDCRTFPVAGPGTHIAIGGKPYTITYETETK